VDYIRERRDPSVPFFLCCSFFKPHPPFDPPEPYYSMYRDCQIPEAVYGDWSEDDRCPEAFKRLRQTNSYDLIPPETIREARAAYYGLITQVDYSLGRILSALDDVGLLDDTLILYVSDHGEFLGDHHIGSKMFFHEPSAHVPLVLRLPKSWEDRRHGTTVSAPVTHADILPTLVAAAGGQPPDGIDGQNLIALARGQLPGPRQYLEGIGPSGGKYDYVGITDGRWKYIWYPEGAAEQLFDLREDPSELRNLVGVEAYSAKRQELEQELVRRHETRASEYAKDGRLVAWPKRGDSVTDRRNQSWPGYRTEYERIERGSH
jgi:arylsulfatase A-like enzyme